MITRNEGNSKDAILTMNSIGQIYCTSEKGLSTEKLVKKIEKAQKILHELSSVVGIGFEEGKDNDEQMKELSIE